MTCSVFQVCFPNLILLDGSRATEHDYTKKKNSWCRGRFLFQKHFSIRVNTQPLDDRRYPYILTVFEQMFLWIFSISKFTQEIFSYLSVGVSCIEFEGDIFVRIFYVICLFFCFVIYNH